MFNAATFKIYRLTATEGSKKSYQDTGATIRGRLEPQDIEFAQISGSGFGKTFKLFSNNISVQVNEADRLVSGNDEYDVKGVQQYNHPPVHLELILEKIIKQ